MRKTANITITAEGRDKGKRYAVTEMPATKAERWATRALIALAKSGLEMPDNFKNAGMAGIAAFGIKALGGIDYAAAEPLLDEMLECVTFLPDPSRPLLSVPVGDGNTEEMSTLVTLRMETMKLHLDFLQAGAPSP